MGTKLNPEENDGFFELEDYSSIGVCGGCYCCGQQIHVSFENMDILPKAKIEDRNFHLFLCDQCESDTETLKEHNLEVSYDLLWIIQENLRNELTQLEEKNGAISEFERNKIFLKIYKEMLKKVKNKDTQSLLLELSKKISK